MFRVLFPFLILFLIVACLSPFLLPSAYLRIAGKHVVGEVTGKREEITMSGNDGWRRVFEVAYRYTPAETGVVERDARRVDAALFDRLQHSPVDVIYSPVHALRLCTYVALGSVLAESSWSSRIPAAGDTHRDFYDLGAVAFSALLAFIAWRTRSRVWILAAALCGATVLSSVFLFGFIAFPVLFGLWRKRPGEGYDWVLLCSVALTAVFIQWRVPRTPTRARQPDRQRRGEAQKAETVDQIWGTRRSGGQSLRQDRSSGRPRIHTAGRKGARSRPRPSRSETAYRAFGTGPT